MSTVLILYVLAIFVHFLGNKCALVIVVFTNN